MKRNRDEKPDLEQMANASSVPVGYVYESDLEDDDFFLADRHTHNAFFKTRYHTIRTQYQLLIVSFTAIKSFSTKANKRQARTYRNS